MAPEGARTDAENMHDDASGAPQAVASQGSSSTSTDLAQPLVLAAVPDVLAPRGFRPPALPVELLSRIFQLLPFAELVQVSHVCHQWHQVAIDYGVLWTDIRSRSRIPGAFEEQMRRSKKAIIRVHVQLQTESLGSFMLLIQQNLARMRYLNISYEPHPPAITLAEANVASILAHLNSPAPVLSDFSITVRDLAGEVPVPVDLFACLSPQLRRASLNGLNSLPTRCDAFSNVNEYHTIHNFHDELGPGLAALGTMFPSLLYLQLGLVGNDMTLPSTPCIVELTELDLIYTSPQFCLAILHYFMNPVPHAASGQARSRRLSRLGASDFPGWFSAFWGDEVLVITALDINADAPGPDRALMVECRIEYEYDHYSCIYDISCARLIAEPGLWTRIRLLALPEAVFWALDHPLPPLPVLETLAITLMTLEQHLLAPAPDAAAARVYLGNIIEDPCSILHHPCTAPRATLVCPALHYLTLNAPRSHSDGRPGREHCTADPSDVLAFIRTHLACDIGALHITLDAVDVQLGLRALEVYELWTSVAHITMRTREHVEENDQLVYESEPATSSGSTSRMGSVSVHEPENNDNE